MIIKFRTCEQAPPTNVMILAPQLGYEASSSPTAMERATPVERRGLWPCCTGQGSRCSSPKRSVRLMSQAETGCRNLGKVAEFNGEY